MATVSVTIAGRTYRMACGEGEEAHLQQLARHVDQTLAAMRKGFGEIGDSRLVMMAAISVADELFEARQRVAELEAALSDVEMIREKGEAMRAALAADMTELLGATSARIETLVQHLNEAGKS